MLTEISAEVRREILDEEHLRLLAIAHYVTGGFAIAFSCLFIFYSFLFLLIARRPDLFRGSSGEDPPAEFMGLFAIIFGLFVIVGWTFGGLTIYAGYCIKRRIHRTLTLVMACFHAAWIPVGSVLGITTLMVLTRASVKRLYTAQSLVVPPPS